MTNLQKEFVFGEERPFSSCHASTLVELSNGEILAAWFGGTEEGAGDVGIWYSRRQQGRWTAPKLLAGGFGVAHWNPVLFHPDDKIYLYYKVGESPRQWSTWIMVSEDLGETWSEPELLVIGDVKGRGPVKNKPIVLHNGTWLAPASIEGEYWDAFVDISTDNGKTWRKSELVPIDHDSFCGKGVIQPTLWESAPGQVHMLLRSTAGRIYRSDSADGGRTWSPAYPTVLPNNNSGIDLVRLQDGKLVLVYNPVAKNWGERTPLVISVSYDNGLTWPKTITLEDGPGEFSYPAVIEYSGGIAITYTWKRKRIAFCTLGFEEL